MHSIHTRQRLGKFPLQTHINFEDPWYIQNTSKTKTPSMHNSQPFWGCEPLWAIQNEASVLCPAMFTTGKTGH